VSSLFAALILTILTLPGFAAPAWRFTIDPALRGNAPHIDASTSGPATDLLTTFSVVTSETSGVLAASVAPSTTSARLQFPEVAADTAVEAAVAPEPADAESLPFRWRGLGRPAGKTIMSYNGPEGFAPPADFDQYWARAKKELAAVPANARVTRQPDRDTSTGLLYRVELDSVQDTTIVGWFLVPREAYVDGDTSRTAGKKFPTILITPGYGAEQGPVDKTKQGYITFSTNPRNHGPSRAFWKSPVDHLVYNITDPDNYYYKLAFLDCLRAAEFVFSREEVDIKRVGAEGGSQGGLLAVATAALEPRIACVAANVPAFTAIPDGTLLATKGGMLTLGTLVREDSTTSGLVRKSLSYIDGAIMASRVKCPTQICMGGLDSVCPYVCGIVMHNRLPKGSERELRLVPDARHEVTPQMRAWNSAWFKKWLGK